MYADVRRFLLGSRVSISFRSGRSEVMSESLYPAKTIESQGVAPSLEEAAQATLEALTDEVQKLKPLAGQLAVPLSGGTDSSLLWALCNRELGIRDSYSTGYSFEDPRRNREKEYALTAAAALGAQHHFFEITTEQFLRAVVECIRVSEEPIYLQGALFQLQYGAGLPPEALIVVPGHGADGLAGIHLQTKLRAARKNLSTRWVAGMPGLALRLARVLHSVGVRTKQLDIALGEHLELADPDNTIWKHEKYGNEDWVRQYFGTTRQQTIQGRYELAKMIGEHEFHDRLVLLAIYSDVAAVQSLYSRIAEAHG
jgi:asparagine synthetase B (glutamine-hydrolysing)